MSEAISIEELKKLVPGKSESHTQQKCVEWFRYLYPKLILFAIPNGGARSKPEASIMKGEGVLKGVLDLFLMEPRGMYHGMFIEMKHNKNGLTREQIQFFLAAEQRKFKCVVCKHLDEFMKEVTNYLNLK